MGHEFTDAEVAIPMVVSESVLDWLSGRKGATYPNSAGTVIASDGTYKRFNQIFTDAAAPRISGPDVQLDDILRQASPLLMVSAAETGSMNALIGGFNGLQAFTLNVFLTSRKWVSASGDRLDHRATKREFFSAVNVVSRLLQAAHGNIPLWDHTKATDALIYASWAGSLFLTERDQRPIVFEDRYEATWRLSLTCQREAD